MRVLLSSLLLIGAVAACGSPQPERADPPVSSTPTGETILVRSVALQTVVPVDGTVVARQEAVLATRLMAAITAIEVEVGDDVRAGQVLVRLGMDDVAANQRRAEAALRVAGAARDEAVRQAARMDTLFAQDAVALVQRDQARLALVHAESQVALAEAARQEVEATARYSVLRAPFDGSVVSRTARVGDLSSPGMPLLAIAAAGPREVVLGVPVEVAHALGPNVEIVVRGDAVGSTAARVRAVATGADPRSRTVEVRADLPSTWPTGVSVTALVPSGTHEGIAIPFSAVVRRGQLTGVRVVGASGESLRWIRLGRRIDPAETHGATEVQVEVLSGLVAGERIAK